ncbi:hypothetical protein IMZ48_32620, partial [Candidatus Bathyarchaeota archaeon]|nr:hypothetical protein [Candidatus Bathyarchaeota archaeon]
MEPAAGAGKAPADDGEPLEEEDEPAGDEVGDEVGDAAGDEVGDDEDEETDDWTAIVVTDFDPTGSGCKSCLELTVDEYIYDIQVTEFEGYYRGTNEQGRSGYIPITKVMLFDENGDPVEEDTTEETGETEETDEPTTGDPLEEDTTEVGDEIGDEETTEETGDEEETPITGTGPVEEEDTNEVQTTDETEEPTTGPDAIAIADWDLSMEPEIEETIEDENKDAFFEIHKDDEFWNVQESKNADWWTGINAEGEQGVLPSS